MTDPRLALFLDRSTQGRRFVEAVRALVDDVETIADRYGRDAAQDISDTQWIAEATAAGRILIGVDRRILLNPLERRAVCRHKARYVAFGTNILRVPDMMALFATSLPAIRAHAGEPGPGVLRIARHGTERLPLRCDDRLRTAPGRKRCTRGPSSLVSRQFLRRWHVGGRPPN